MQLNKTRELGLAGVFLIEPLVFEDERGSFTKTYTAATLAAIGAAPIFHEEYHNVSRKGVVRGLHYQRGPFAQAKLVRCIHGSIFDVIVDLRVASPTFGKWIGTELPAENGTSLYVPRGMAHGYMALEEGTEVLYKADNDYAPLEESGLFYNDPALGISYPLEKAVLSEKDRKLPLFKDCEKYDPPCDCEECVGNIDEAKR